MSSFEEMERFFDNPFEDFDHFNNEDEMQPQDKNHLYRTLIEFCKHAHRFYSSDKMFYLQFLKAKKTRDRLLFDFTFSKSILERINIIQHQIDTFCVKKNFYKLHHVDGSFKDMWSQILSFSLPCVIRTKYDIFNLLCWRKVCKTFCLAIDEHLEKVNHEICYSDHPKWTGIRVLYMQKTKQGFDLSEWVKYFYFTEWKQNPTTFPLISLSPFVPFIRLKFIIIPETVPIWIQNLKEKIISIELKYYYNDMDESFFNIFSFEKIQIKCHHCEKNRIPFLFYSSVKHLIISESMVTYLYNRQGPSTQYQDRIWNRKNIQRQEWIGYIQDFIHALCQCPCLNQLTIQQGERNDFILWKQIRLDYKEMIQSKFPHLKLEILPWSDKHNSFCTL